MQAVLGRDAEGKLIRKAGVMAIVLDSDEGGRAIPLRSSCRPHRALAPV